MSVTTFSRRFVLAAVSTAALVLSGCGGTASTTSSLSVTPALGAVYGAVVNVYNASGSLLGTGTTDSTTGKVTVTLYGYTSGTPIIVKVTLPAGSSYYNEKTGANETITSSNTTSLLSVVASVSSGSSVGVTALTNMAAKFAGVDVSTVGSATLSVALTASAVNTAVVQTNLALGLPAGTLITAAPVAATLAAPSPTDTYGSILATMAKYSTGSPLTQATSLAAAVTLTNGVASISSTAPTIVTSINSNLSTYASSTVTVSTPNTAPSAAVLAAGVTSQAAAVTTGTFATGTGTGSSSL